MRSLTSKEFKTLLTKDAGKKKMYDSVVASISSAIADMEGFTSGASKIARLNNNPGNIRFWHSSLPMNQGFTKFASLEDGWNALNELVQQYIYGKYHNGKSPTLEEVFAKYAPAADKNDPVRYAQVVSSKTGIPLGVPLQDYIKSLETKKV